MPILVAESCCDEALQVELHMQIIPPGVGQQGELPFIFLFLFFFAFSFGKYIEVLLVSVLGGTVPTVYKKP